MWRLPVSIGLRPCRMLTPIVPAKQGLEASYHLYNQVRHDLLLRLISLSWGVDPGRLFAQSLPSLSTVAEATRAQRPSASRKSRMYSASERVRAEGWRLSSSLTTSPYLLSASRIWSRLTAVLSERAAYTSVTVPLRAHTRRRSSIWSAPSSSMRHDHKRGRRRRSSPQ